MPCRQPQAPSHTHNSCIPSALLLLSWPVCVSVCVPARLLLQPDAFTGRKIIDREDEYKKRRLNQKLSPERVDAYAAGEQTPAAHLLTYAEIMKQKQLEREQANTLENIAKAKEQAAAAVAAAGAAAAATTAAPAAVGQKRRNRWDVGDAEEL